jgi:hypothetical protein
VLGAAPVGERGQRGLGDLGVGDPPLLVFVVDGVRGIGVHAVSVMAVTTVGVSRAVTESRAPTRRQVATMS